ncbi:MAG TPA: HAD-IA family hydrolase [Candidatus Saccharimonadales bacterium]
MIKAVLFDYGGVLTEGGKVGGIPETLGALYGIAPDEIRIADLHEKLIVGAINETQFFEELNSRYGKVKKLDVTTFNANNHDFVTPCKPVYSLAARLRGAGIRTGILSNVYAIAAEQLRSAGLYKDFDPVVLSCEEHLAKPAPALYERTLQKLGLSGSEALFIDDQERFMPPKELGIHTILAVSPQQIVADVTALIYGKNKIKV